MSPTYANCGFIAGTLVHTDKGLTPIELIKVGDRVLSQPEQGSGERIYKQVVKTQTREDERISAIEYYAIPKDATEEALQNLEENRLLITDDHPFWVRDQGWMEPPHVMSGDILEIAEGIEAVVSGNKEVWATKNPNIGWVHDHEAYDEDRDYCVEFDPCGQMCCMDTQGEQYIYEGQYVRAFTCRAYNLEVEDFHTYFVGEKGVWVHDLNSPE